MITIIDKLGIANFIVQRVVYAHVLARIVCKVKKIIYQTQIFTHYLFTNRLKHIILYHILVLLRLGNGEMRGGKIHNRDDVINTSLIAKENLVEVLPYPHFLAANVVEVHINVVRTRFLSLGARFFIVKL